MMKNGKFNFLKMKMSLKSMQNMVVLTGKTMVSKTIVLLIQGCTQNRIHKGLRGECQT